MSESNSPSEAFVGVRFVLHGFDSINQHQVRSKLVEGGGVDVGQYGQNCTHVIVDNIVYDDPICVAARNDGKTLVTTLWVDHSFDVGLPVDTTSIMYRPLKELKGIPGAQSLVMCLTGYQRQDREDIMTMASLMGAQFTKSLLANKVTHLICYKFEGEKYDLAKKIKRIKLVNHYWLEDCLRDWEILPEANYTKSGYELEMETEAMDSEEEAENTTVKPFGGPNIKKSPQNLSIEMPRARELPKSVGKGSIVLSDSTALKGPLNFVNLKDRSPTPIEENTSRRFSSSNVTEILDNQKTGAFGDAGCGELPNPHDRTPDSSKVRNELASTSRCAKRPLHSDAEFSATSYSRRTPRRSSLSLYSGEISNDPRECMKVSVGEFNINDVSKVSPFKVEQEKDRLGSGSIEAPPKGTDIHLEQESSGMLPQKRKTDISPGSFKLKRMSPEAKQSIVGIPSVSNKRQGLEATFLTASPPETNNHSPLGNDGHFKDKASNLNTGNSPASVSTTKPSSFNKKSLICDLPLSKKITSAGGQVDSTKEKSPETSGRLRKLSLASEPDIGDFGNVGSIHLPGETQKPQNQQQDVKVSSPGNRESKTEKSHKAAILELLKGRNDAKPLRKKTLGSKPKLSNTTNKKGSTYIRESASRSDAANSLSRGEVTADSKLSSSNKLDISPPTVNAETTNEAETKAVIKSGDQDKNETDFLDDETEAPEDKDEHEFGKSLDEEKSFFVELSRKADVMMEDKSEGRHNKTNISKDGVHDDAMVLEEGANVAEIENAVSDKNFEVGESTSRGDGVKGKMNKGKKRNSGETTMKTVRAAVEIMKPKKGVAGKKTQNVKNMKMGMQKGKKVLCPASKTKSGAASVNKSEKSIEVEKENKPVADGVQNNSQETLHEGKSTVKSTKMPVKVNQKAAKINHNLKLVGEVPGKGETEPVWFILSGHKLQKKEFQQVIRRLKGKICRDSHQWSYQATHFIAPDPIKRIEKFFAAAASGRWILKTDYLTASCQAGRFLAEDPYEWHKNGLSEDGAINLEAPRKWRLLRERTHHGAFYKMRIIIYGECIAPPLDTLKRVVKSGDGTILATSPPYTRFLNTGVDFAVVSPGMPRVDLWVQEFLKHEIPCVVADYLVEYVCKPGYSLDRHVLYNTHAWAEKSYANLLSRGEEIIEDFTPPGNSSSDDLICDVCRSSDRGEVMLICSDESGSLGCGIGTHIDCCDPPLEAVPEEDWFCPNCSRSSSSKGSSKSGKKSTALKGK